MLRVKTDLLGLLRHLLSNNDLRFVFGQQMVLIVLFRRRQVDTDHRLKVALADRQRPTQRFDGRVQLFGLIVLLIGRQ